MRLPPRWLRRLVFWPLPLILAVVYVTTVLLLETAIVVASLAMWVVSGLGWKLRSPRFVAAHYRLLGWTLDVLVGAGRRLFVLDVVSGTPDESDDDRALHGADDVPLIVMSRHAGPADSILLMHGVMARYGRRPRIVLTAALRLDPAIDILSNRLPNRFVTPGQDTRKPCGWSEGTRPAWTNVTRS